MGDKLSHTGLMKLASIALNAVDSDADKVGWLDPNEGTFFVSSAYDLFVGASEAGVWRSWSLWRLRV